jgi:hypothetical protein
MKGLGPMKVRELAKWPPAAKGAANSELRLPTPVEAIVVKTIFCRDYWLTFVCGFGGDLFVYDYEADNQAIAQQLEGIVEASVGKSLLSIGEIELQTS